MFRDNLHKTAPVISYGFLVAVDAEEGTSLELIKDRIAGACTWVEGVGRTDVDYIGIVSEHEDDEA